MNKEELKIAVKLLRVGKNFICVDFSKKYGSAIYFYETVMKFKYDLSLCNNATQEEALVGAQEAAE